MNLTNTMRLVVVYSCVLSASAVAAGPADSDRQGSRLCVMEQPRSFDNEALFARVEGDIVRSDRLVGTGGMFGDFDGDDDVDLYDYNAIQICHSLSGPDVATPTACAVFDADSDEDIDLSDIGAFMDVYTGILSGVVVNAGGLVPVAWPDHTVAYHSGEPGTLHNNALNGVAAQAGYVQDDLWYDWTILSQPIASGIVVLSNSSEPDTAYTILPDMLPGVYEFQLTVTNLITLEFGQDVVALSVAACITHADCHDGNLCTLDACVAGACSHTPNALPCDDGLFCNGADTCSGGTCSLHAGDPCGGFACNEVQDTCGGGTVTLLPPVVDHSRLCFGQQTVITATASGGTGVNMFTFTVGNPLLPGEMLVPGPGSNQATYTGPAAQATTQTITISVTESGGSSDQTQVPIETIDPATCVDGEACTTDVCDFGVCNNLPVAVGIACGDPTDDACTNPDTCDGAGACVANHEFAGTACGDAGDTECDDPDSCDGAGTCVANHVADGTGCTDDGNDCTGDTCSGGVCAHANLVVGTACGSAATTQCTVPDTCNGAGFCQPNNLADGTSCPDDGNDCTLDACDTGVCAHPNKPAGSACGDAVVSDCDAADTCDAAGTCLPNPAVDGDPCTNDGNACTDDVCGGGACTHPNLADGAACDDGLFCTATDTCTTGVCGGSGGTCTPPDLCSEAADACVECLVDGDCTDVDICTTDICAAGTCLHIPNTVACDDLLFCNGPDSCSGGTCSIHAGSPCAEACDEASDSCVACLVDGDCDDGNPCTNNTCTAGVCQSVNNTDGCDDGLFCTATDTCSGGVCVGSGAPCNPGNPFCHEASDSCKECLNGAHCDDGNVCTTDICDASFQCSNGSNSDPCDDGLFCNGVDTCSGGVCSIHAGDPCSGGPECADNCDEGANTCHRPAGTACGIGSDTDCTDPDTCDGVGTCDSNDVPDGTACNDCPLGPPDCDVCSAGVCENL